MFPLLILLINCFFFDFFNVINETAYIFSLHLRISLQFKKSKEEGMFLASLINTYKENCPMN